MQVITVTHLPQVAASADHQLLVSKSQQGQNVVSNVSELDNDGRVEEISRMMGGSVVTEATRQSAQALLNKASQKA